MITLLKFNGRNHPHSEILTCRQLHCLLALKITHVATANSGHQQRFREHTWLKYCLRRGDPLSESLGRGRNARNSPLPLRSQKLITIPAYLRTGLKLCKNVDQRLLGQIVLRLLTRSPLSPLWKVAEVGEGQ